VAMQQREAMLLDLAAARAAVSGQLLFRKRFVEGGWFGHYETRPNAKGREAMCLPALYVDLRWLSNQGTQS
jgi:hypothetical protein